MHFLCQTQRQVMLVGWYPLSGILHKDKYSVIARFGLRSKSEILTQCFSNEVAGDPNFLIKSKMYVILMSDL